MVNLSRVKNDLEAKFSVVGEGQLTMSKATELMEEVFTKLKKLIARLEINILDVFLDSNRNDDFISEHEFHQVLTSLELPGLLQNHSKAVFQVLDPRATGKLEQDLFLRKFLDFANKD